MAILAVIVLSAFLLLPVELQAYANGKARTNPSEVYPLISSTTTTQTGLDNYTTTTTLTPISYRISIVTDKASYYNGETVLVTGVVSPAPNASGSNIAVTIVGPNGAIVDADQFSVLYNSGVFSGTFTTGGPLYSMNGTYTVAAHYNDQIASTQFQYILIQHNQPNYNTLPPIFLPSPQQVLMNENISGFSLQITNPINNSYPLTSLVIVAPINWTFSGTPLCGSALPIVAERSSSFIQCAIRYNGGLLPGSNSTLALGSLTASSSSSHTINGRFAIIVVDGGGGSSYSGGTFSIYASPKPGTNCSSNSSSQFATATGDTGIAKASGIFTLTCWNPVVNSYPFVNYGGVASPGGWCYGMSSTTVIYFDHYTLAESGYPLFPKQVSEANSTSQLNEPFNYMTTLNNVTLPIVVHQVYDPSNFFFPFLRPNENNQFNILLSNLQNGQPVVLSLSSNSNNEGHAVVAWGVAQLPNGTDIIAISDPNLPEQSMLAYFFQTNSTFSYHDGYSWNYFSTINPVPAQAQWSYILPGASNVPVLNWIVWLVQHVEYWWRNWLQVSVPNYYIVISDSNVTIRSGNLVDKFDQSGNSESFVSQIPGTSGVEESNVQFFAIPVGTDFSIQDPSPIASNSSILITRIDNYSGNPTGYAYALETSPFDSSKSLNYGVHLSDSNSKFSISDTIPMVLNLTLLTANSTGHSSFSATKISIPPGQPSNFCCGLEIA
jgi:hypothetical protein